MTPTKPAKDPQMLVALILLPNPSSPLKVLGTVWWWITRHKKSDLKPPYGMKTKTKAKLSRQYVKVISFCFLQASLKLVKLFVFFPSSSQKAVHKQKKDLQSSQRRKSRTASVQGSGNERCLNNMRRNLHHLINGFWSLLKCRKQL